MRDNTAPSPVTRFAWQTGGLVIGRGAAFAVLLLMANDLGQATYGRFVVLLALLELATVPWKPTVQQGAAAAFGVGAGHGSWRRTMLTWWVLGSVLVGPIALAFSGWLAAGAVVGASAANALMIEHWPGHILAGRQRRIAGAMLASQGTRLVVTVLFVATGHLTPTWGITIHAVGYLAGAISFRTAKTDGSGGLGRLTSEVGSEGLRWVELHGPILIVATVLSLGAAGGFDLLYKLAIALAELAAGVGIILLPALVRTQSIGPTIARGIRLPTVLTLLGGAAFAIAARPVLEAATNFDIGSDLAPVLLAVAIVLGPFMGVTKAALLTTGGAGWLVPSQLATAVATVAASWLAGFGLTWAAAAVAVAHIVGAGVRWHGLRTHSALPNRADVLSARLLADDFASLRRVMRRGGD